MTDQELIKFLRTSTSAVFNKTTANRIEELTLQLLATSGQAADALDKLTKAVEALRFYSPQTVGGITFVGGDDAGKRAAAVLAELDGEPLGAEFEAVWLREHTLSTM